MLRLQAAKWVVTSGHLEAAGLSLSSLVHRHVLRVPAAGPGERLRVRAFIICKLRCGL